MDWKNPDDYAYTSQLDDAGWDWEFLRRDEEYVDDYHKYLNDKEENPQPEKGNTFLFRTTALPPECAENKKGWVKDCILCGERPERHSAEAWYGRKWGLKKIVSPEALYDPTTIQFTFHNKWPQPILNDQIQDYFYQPDDPHAPHLPITTLKLLAFDLSVPLKQQLEKAENYLLKEKKRLETAEKVDSSSHRNRTDIWPRYLRILDAKSAIPAATNPEIAPEV